MMKFFSCFLFFVSSVCCYAESFPYFIDFGTKEFENGFYDQEFLPELATSCPFNCALELSTFFFYVRDHLDIRTVVETGTFKGNTAAFFGSCFDRVHTIEIDPFFYAEATSNLASYPNVFCHAGSSPSCLKELLPSLVGQRVLFYLDAHWLSDWPLLAELKQIQKTHKNNCIIVIDDFKVPGRPDVPYDTHGNNEYSFEYIKNSIDRIFTDYSVHYLIPKHVQARGKFVAMPRKWAVK